MFDVTFLMVLGQCQLSIFTLTACIRQSRFDPSKALHKVHRPGNNPTPQFMYLFLVILIENMVDKVQVSQAIQHKQTCSKRLSKEVKGGKDAFTHCPSEWVEQKANGHKHGYNNSLCK